MHFLLTHLDFSRKIFFMVLGCFTRISLPCSIFFLIEIAGAQATTEITILKNKDFKDNKNPLYSPSLVPDDTVTAILTQGFLDDSVDIHLRDCVSLGLSRSASGEFFFPKRLGYFSSDEFDFFVYNPIKRRLVGVNRLEANDHDFHFGASSGDEYRSFTKNSLLKLKTATAAWDNDVERSDLGSLVLKRMGTGRSSFEIYGFVIGRNLIRSTNIGLGGREYSNYANDPQTLYATSVLSILGSQDNPRFSIGISDRDNCYAPHPQ